MKQHAFKIVCFAVLVVLVWGADLTILAQSDDWEMLGPVGGGIPFMNPENPEMMYAWSGSEGIFKSTDGGKYWTWMKNGFKTEEILSYSAFAIDPTDFNRLFLVVYDDTVYPDEHVGLYRSENGGETWQRIWTPDGAESLHAPMAISYSNLDVILCDMWIDGYQYLCRSADGGHIWDIVPVSFPGGVTSITFHPTDPDLVVMATTTQILTSADSGLTWSSQPVAIPNMTRIDACKVDPADTGSSVHHGLFVRQYRCRRDL